MAKVKKEVKSKSVSEEQKKAKGRPPKTKKKESSTTELKEQETKSIISIDPVKLDPTTTSSGSTTEIIDLSVVVKVDGETSEVINIPGKENFEKEILNLAIPIIKEEYKEESFDKIKSVEPITDTEQIITIESNKLNTDSSLQNIDVKTEAPLIDSNNDVSNADVENKDETLKNTENEVIKEDFSSSQKVELSYMANQYKKYIEYLRMTPQQFLAKYPTHKFKSAVEELIEWQVKTNNVL